MTVQEYIKTWRAERKQKQAEQRGKAGRLGKSSRLLTLDQLARAENALPEKEQGQNAGPEAPPSTSQAGPSWPGRAATSKKPRRRFGWLRCLLWGLGLPLLLLVSAVFWLTSPMGEVRLTKWVTQAINYAGQPVGLRVELSSLRGLWQQQLRVRGLAIYDSKGLWLTVEEGVLHPRWGSLARGAAAVLQKRRGQDVSPALRVDVPATPTPTSFNPADYEQSTQPEKRDLAHTAVDVSQSPSVGIVQQQKTTHNGTVQQHTFTKADTPAVADPAAPAANENLPDAKTLMDALLEPEDVTSGKVTVALALGTLLGVEMSRYPVFLTPEPSATNTAVLEETGQGPIVFLPSWLAVDIGELEVARFHLGPKGEDAYITARLHGQISDTKMRIRATVLGEKNAMPQKVLPPIQDLPGDVTLSLRQLRGVGRERQASPVAVPQSMIQGNELSALLSLDWDRGEVDLRWHLRDSLVLAHLFPGVQRMWSRARVMAHVPQWPPTPEHSLRVRTASRFGLRIVGTEDRVRASLFSGQIFWDGQRMILRDMRLAIPANNPHLLFTGSAGMDPRFGPGMQLRFDMNDLALLGRALGLDLWKQRLGGNLELAIDVGRGGPYSLWWTSPHLVADKSKQGGATAKDRSLPGFFFDPHDKALLAHRLQSMADSTLRALDTLPRSPDGKNAKGRVVPGKGDKKQKAETGAAVAASSAMIAPRATGDETALQVRIKLNSEEIHLPAGRMEKLSLLLRGTSVDVSTAPEGTAFRRQNGTLATVADKAGHGSASQLSGKQSSGQSSEQLAQSGKPHAAGQPEAGQVKDLGKPSSSATAKHNDTVATRFEGDADFTALGLPRGLMGELELNAQNIFGMGAGAVHSQWLLGGMHGDADVFLAKFDKLNAALPGLRAQGDLGFSYALPMRRRWPWIDGSLRVELDKWRSLSALVESPVQGDELDLRLRMESLMEDGGSPRQYLKAELAAQRVNAPAFVARAVRGNAESYHVHALADTLALALAPPFQAPSSPENAPPPDFRLLNAKVQLGSGSGGPIRWESGQAAVQVAGEAATFEATLKGLLHGILEGSYNFRQRLLQLRRMEIFKQENTKGAGSRAPRSQGANSTDFGLKLQKTANISLLGGMTLQNFGLDFMPGGHVTLNGGLLLPSSSAAAAVLPPVSEAAAASTEHVAANTVADAASMTAASMTAALEADGILQDPWAGAHWQVQGRVQKLPLDLPRRVLAFLGQDVPLPEGMLACTLALNGPLRAPEGALKLSLTDIRWPEALLPPLQFSLAADVNKAALVRMQAELGGLPQSAPLKASLSLPLRYDPLPTLDSSRQALAQASWQGDLAPLWRYVPLPGRTLKGKLAFELSASMRGKQWQWQGRADLADGHFVDQVLGLRLEHMQFSANRGMPLKARGEGRSTDIVHSGSVKSGSEDSHFSASVSDGRGGKAMLQGSLTQPQGQGLSISAQGHMDKLRPLHRDDLSLQLSGKLALEGPLTSPLLSGSIVLDQGAFALLRNFSTPVRHLEEVEEGALRGPVSAPRPNVSASDSVAVDSTDGVTVDTRPSVTASVAPAVAEQGPEGAEAFPVGVPRLHLDIKAPGHFFIRGQGLDSEWRANLQVRGHALKPRLMGELAPVRGNFALLGRNFRFEKGQIRFNGQENVNPALNLGLAFQNPQITALVRVSGTAKRLRLDLSSQPALPRDEVMAQVLFGKSMERLSRFEALQAAAAARQLVDGGAQSLDVMNAARDVLGLEVLRLGSGTGKKEVRAPRDASMRGAAASEEGEAETTVEAGKYLTDNIYVGVEQSTKASAGTAVRVDVELTPHISVSGRTSPEGSGVGVNWKWDY